MEITYLVVYAGDTQADGTQCGPETRARCDRAVQFARDRPNEQVTIILAAGKRPDKPDYPMLKQVMFDYLLSKGLFAALRMTETSAWGTYQETASAIKALAARGNEMLVTDTVYICSSRHHLPRIRLIWRLLGSKVQLVNVPAPIRNWDEVLLEPLKVVKAFFTWWKRKQRH